MKKWMMTWLLIGLTALSASAAWWPFGQEAEANEDGPPPPRSERFRSQMEDRDGERPPHLSPEQREEMKAQRKAIMDLGEAARTETDPAKKEELIAQLRAELSKVADKMQETHERRLEQAEKELGKLRARMDEAQANRDQLIEKQIKRILSGEKPEPPEDGPREGGRFRRGPESVE